MPDRDLENRASVKLLGKKAKTEQSEKERSETPIARPSEGDHPLLRLQLSHGNRSVQKQVELARQAEEDKDQVSAEVEKSIERERGSGHVLDHEVRAQMESAFNADFSSVRVHTDAKADRLNRQLNARAFATGKDLFFRQSAYSPGSSSGRELLAHELTHVLQQTAKLRRSLTVGCPTDEYEKEANQVAGAVMEMEKQTHSQKPGGVERNLAEARIGRQIEEDVERRKVHLQAEDEKGPA